MRPKVYIGELLPEKKSYLPILYPNLGRQHKPDRLFLDRAYDVLHEPIVEIVSDPALCDYFLLPYDYFNIEKFTKYLSNFSELAQKYDKKVLIFDFSDFDRKIDIPNSVQFRVSLYKSSKRENERENEFAIPPFVENLEAFEPRNKSEVPVVGFVGFSKFSWRGLLSSGPRRPGLYFRHRAVKILKNSRDIVTNIKERSGYAGHKDTIGMDPEVARREYLDNICNSDLVLCVKGDGNYSIRFFETLALGRIPILIDTDCSLPLEEEIDYDKFILRVDYRDLEKLPEIISNWWQNISNEDFESMQKQAREAFENYLRMDKFLPRIFEQAHKSHEL